MQPKLRPVPAAVCLSLVLAPGLARAQAAAPRAVPAENLHIHVQNAASSIPGLRRVSTSSKLLEATRPLTPANPDTSARLAYVSGELTRNAGAERLWWYGWIGGFAALSVGQGYFFFTRDDPAERILNAVGGGMSLIGLAGLLVLPNDGRFADEDLADLPEGSAEERSAKLARAESMLGNAAEATRRKRNALAVVGPVLVSFGTAAYVWAKYDAAVPALRTMVGALAINVAHWWTRPTANAEAARRYRGQSAELDWRLTPWISPRIVGLGLGTPF
ncbi:MAG: hypothetical protein R3B89_34790 [Polyangiaceae bacterium]